MSRRFRPPARLAVRASRYAVLALCACGIACSRAQPDDALPPPNVLLVVVDTLRLDHLQSYGYARRPTSPALAALADEGAVYEGLLGVSSWTKPTVATLFTGLPPADHGVMRLVGAGSRLRDDRTLAAEFARGGWDTGGVMSNFLLTRRLGSGYDAGFADWNEEPARRPDPHRGSTAPEVADAGIAWLQRRGTRPWFLMLHFFDPHAAFEDHPEHAWEDPAYEGWVEPGADTDVLRAHEHEVDAADRAQLTAYYDEEIRAVDDALGRVLEVLRSRPDWDRTVIVFTSDHGEEFGERGHIGHTQTLHHELVDLALVVRVPPAYAERWGLTEVAGGHAQVELYAAMLRVAGLPVPEGRGVPPAGYLPTEVDFVPIRAEHEEKFVRKRAVIAEDHKLIRDLRGGGERLYRLDEDPGEWSPLPDGEGADVRARLRALMDAHAWWEAP